MKNLPVWPVTVCVHLILAILAGSSLPGPGANRLAHPAKSLFGAHAGRGGNYLQYPRNAAALPGCVKFFNGVFECSGHVLVFARQSATIAL